MDIKEYTSEEIRYASELATKVAQFRWQMGAYKDTYDRFNSDNLAKAIAAEVAYLIGEPRVSSDKQN